MKRLLFVLLTMVSIISSAQEIKFQKPNYGKIEKEIKDSISDFYYKKLKEKFDGGDFTMTIQEKRNLYYGFIFQESYSSQYSSKELDNFIEILKKGDINESDYDKIISYGDSILKENPFDLRAMNYQRYVFEKKGLTNRMIIRTTQIRMVVDAILSSGEGTNKENAFFVINIAHEYDILNILGFEYGGNQSLIETFDYLKVKENKNKIEGLYFDISPSLRQYEATFSNNSLNKEELIGTWNITNVLETSENKYLAELIKGFEVSSFTFDKDNSFHFKSRDKSRGILEFVKMMGTSSWIFDSNKNIVKVGSKKDHYTLMGFKVIKKNGKIFFALKDTGMSLTFEVKKS